MRSIVNSLYVKTDLTATSLSTGALGQVVLKLLYDSDAPLGTKELSKRASGVAGCTIGETRITASLLALESAGSLHHRGANYELRTTKREEIRCNLEARQSRINLIYSKYFANPHYDQVQIEKWQNDVLVEFFTKYATIWINEATGKSSGDHSFRADKSIVVNGRIFDRHFIKTEHCEALTIGMMDFLASKEPPESAVMWDYASSAFAAKLIASRVFSDKSVSDLLGRSLAILDTNILMGLDLEKDGFSDLYERLALCLKQINVRTGCFVITKNEYKRVIEVKIAEVDRAFRKFSRAVLEETDDVFIQTALHRGCSTTDDLQTFYSTLRTPPDVFGDHLPVEVIDNRELSDSIVSGEMDDKLKSQLNEIYKSRHRQQDKRVASLSHDAGMVTGVRVLRSSERTWILTRDGSLGAYSKAFPELGDYPLSISLETLINLLAVNDAGTNGNSTDFGRIFSAFSNHRVFPGAVMQVEDLTRLIDVEAQFAELPADEIDIMARKVNKLRFDGASDGDVAIEISRTFQRYKKRFETQLEEQQRATSITNTLLEGETIRSKRLADSLRSDLARKFKRRCVRKLLIEVIGFGLLCLIGIAFVLFLIGLYSLNNQDDSTVKTVIGVSINVLSTVILEILFFWPRASKRYKERIDELPEEIERKIRAIEEGTP